MGKNTLSLIIFNLINTGAQFLIVIILSRLFLPIEYATYRQFFLPFELSAPLIGLALSNTIFYFYPRYPDKQNLLLSILIILLVTCVILEFFLLIGLDGLISEMFENKQLGDYLRYLGIFSFFSLGNTILYSFYTLENNIQKSIKINGLFNIVLISALLWLGFSSGNIKYAIYLRILTYGLSFFSMLTLSGIWRRPKLSLQELLSNIKSILTYSTPIAFSLLIGILSYQLDKFFVSYFETPEVYAVYVNGAVEIPLFSIVTSSLAAASFGLFTSFCKEKNYLSANNLFKKISLTSAILLFPSFFFLMIFADDMMLILFGSNYSESSLIFRIYLFLLPIRIIQYGNVLIALGKSKILLVRSSIELFINIILSLILYRFIGVAGIAMGTVISVLIWTVPYNLSLIAKGFGYAVPQILPYKKLALIIVGSILAGGAVLLLIYMLPHLNIYLNIAISATLFSIIYIFQLFGYKILRIDLNSRFKLILT